MRRSPPFLSPSRVIPSKFAFSIYKCNRIFLCCISPNTHWLTLPMLDSPTLSHSLASLHADGQYDLEYDVYMFWPSNVGTYTSSGQGFVHVRHKPFRFTVATAHDLFNSPAYHTPCHCAVQSLLNPSVCCIKERNLRKLTSLHNSP